MVKMSAGIDVNSVAQAFQGLPNDLLERAFNGEASRLEFAEALGITADDIDRYVKAHRQWLTDDDIEGLLELKELLSGSKVGRGAPEG